MPPRATTRPMAFRQTPPTTASLAAIFTASARQRHYGRRSLPPTEQEPVPRSEQETWRERPRCARCKWPRARPEGRSRHGCQCLCRSSERRCSVPGIARIRYMLARGTERRSSGQSGPARAGNPGHEAHSFRARSRDRSGVRRERDRGTLLATQQSKEPARRRMRRPSRLRC